MARAVETTSTEHFGMRYFKTFSSIFTLYATAIADVISQAPFPYGGRDGRRHPPHGFNNSRDGDRGGRTGTLAFRYDYRQQYPPQPSGPDG